MELWIDLARGPLLRFAVALALLWLLRLLLTPIQAFRRGRRLMLAASTGGLLDYFLRHRD